LFKKNFYCGVNIIDEICTRKGGWKTHRPCVEDAQVLADKAWEQWKATVGMVEQSTSEDGGIKTLQIHHAEWTDRHRFIAISTRNGHPSGKRLLIQGQPGKMSILNRDTGVQVNVTTSQLLDEISDMGNRWMWWEFVHVWEAFAQGYRKGYKRTHFETPVEPQ
jgi:hypothetical protein